MASLRRLASLDSLPNSCSNPASCTSRLVRHSSLPNLFLGEPELSFKALCMAAPVSCGFPASIELHSQTLRSKLPLCRALSTNSYDEQLPYLDIPTAAADACSFFARPIDIYTGRRCPTHGLQKSPRKEAVLAVGKQSLDLEKSIVYTELKESLRKLEAPVRFRDSEANPSSATNTHVHTHIHEASKPMKNSNLCMESIQIGAKGRPLSLRRMPKKKSSQGAAPHADCNMNPCRPSNRSKQLYQKCPSSRAGSNHDSKLQIFSDAYDSVSCAFASLFYILKMLQQHTLSLRIQSQSSVFESDGSCYENLVSRTCTEMLDSFLWLFQQVFSCTPELMLLTMVLLADFTLHSMSMHVAFPVMPLRDPQTPSNFPLSIEESAVAEAAVIDAHNTYHNGPEERHKVGLVPSKNLEKLLRGAHSGLDVNGSNARTGYGDSNAEDPYVPWPKTTAEGGCIVNEDNTHGGVTLSSLPSSLLHTVDEKQSEFSSCLNEIDRNVLMRLLVAPVRAPTLEADDYPCFDRTDLAYQHEISMDPTNPLLLANYAQFLHLVRHDHGRAEELYKRAVSAEAEVDGDVMGRFASFLWVAKGDVAEADKAFKATTVADPTNAFHAGNYAHFLWTSSAGQA